MAERPIATLQALIVSSEDVSELYNLHDELARATARAAKTLVVFEGDPRLVAYQVSFASTAAYRFWAEDAHHAVEQGKNAEPEETVVQVRLELQGESA